MGNCKYLQVEFHRKNFEFGSSMPGRSIAFWLQTWGSTVPKIKTSLDDPNFFPYKMLQDCLARECILPARSCKTHIFSAIFSECFCNIDIFLAIWPGINFRYSGGVSNWLSDEWRFGLIVTQKALTGGIVPRHVLMLWTCFVRTPFYTWWECVDSLLVYSIIHVFYLLLACFVLCWCRESSVKVV